MRFDRAGSTLGSANEFRQLRQELGCRRLGHWYLGIFEQFQVARIGLERIVRRFVIDEQAERLVGPAVAQEFLGFAGEELRVVDLLAIDVVKVFALAAPSIPDIKDAFVRFAANAPFAEAAGAVARLLEQRRKTRCQNLGRQRRAEIADLVIAAIAAGDQAGARDTADGSRDKVVLEEHSFAR